MGAEVSSFLKVRLDGVTRRDFTPPLPKTETPKRMGRPPKGDAALLGQTVKMTKADREFVEAAIDREFNAACAAAREAGTEEPKRPSFSKWSRRVLLQASAG